MASAAFRERDGLEPGGDMVRRLLTHSARARSHEAGAARPVPAARLGDETVANDEYAIEALLETARLEEEVVCLEAELNVLRAALRAEQEANAALRAELDQAKAYATPVVDIRSDRDRWATLVERLLFVER